MKRRNFIKNVSALSIAAGIGAWGCKSGINKETNVEGNNIKWAMGWLLWRDYKGNDIPLRNALVELHELGLDGIEFTPRPGELEKHSFTHDSFMELLKELNLQVSGHYFSGAFYDSSKHEDLKQALQGRINSIKSFGGRNIIVGPPDIPSEKQDHIELIKQMAPFVNELGKMAVDQGVEIGIHPHLNTIVETPEEIDVAMESTDPRYINMSPDTGHIYLGGGDVVEILSKYWDRINYFHFKDGAGKFNRPDFFPNMRELGKGEVDFQAVMKLLNEKNYSGWINVEQDFTNQTPEESAKQSMQFIENQLKPIVG